MHEIRVPRKTTFVVQSIYLVPSGDLLAWRSEAPYHEGIKIGAVAHPETIRGAALLEAKNSGDLENNFEVVVVKEGSASYRPELGIYSLNRDVRWRVQRIPTPIQPQPQLRVVPPIVLAEIFRWLILQDSAVKNFEYCGLPLVGVIQDGSYRFGRTQELATACFKGRGRPNSVTKASLASVTKMVLEAL